MNEDKLNLLLRCWLSDKNDPTHEAVEIENNLIKEVELILNPTKEPSITERTHDAFCEDSE